jgi:hypothetical protein
MHRTEELDERLFSAHPGNICIRARAGGYPSRCAPELDRPHSLQDLAELRDTQGRRNIVGVELWSINDCSDGPLAWHSPGDLLLER